MKKSGTAAVGRPWCGQRTMVQSGSTFDDLVQNFIKPGIIGVQSQLLGHEADGGVVDAVQLLDSSLHLGGAVGTVQINELKVLFHGKVSISL